MTGPAALPRRGLALLALALAVVALCALSVAVGTRSVPWSEILGALSLSLIHI